MNSQIIPLGSRLTACFPRILEPYNDQPFQLTERFTTYRVLFIDCQQIIDEYLVDF